MRTQDLHKRELIKEKATELIGQNGLRGFSMRKLAKETGLSASTMYTYYKDEDALLEDLYKYATYRLSFYRLGNFNKELTLRENLWNQWELRYAIIWRRPVFFEFLEQLRGMRLATRRSSNDEYFQYNMHEFIRTAIQKKQIMDMPPEVFWALTYGPLYILIRFHMEKCKKLDKPFHIDHEVLKYTFERAIRSVSPQ